MRAVPRNDYARTDHDEPPSDSGPPADNGL
ncbi:MAG: hypothetical protein JWR58_3284, partial [Pseudonocardia sp.]|nr:hypothetical protein [Pseudonocardia sp.]